MSRHRKNKMSDHDKRSFESDQFIKNFEKVKDDTQFDLKKIELMLARNNPAENLLELIVLKDAFTGGSEWGDNGIILLVRLFSSTFELRYKTYISELFTIYMSEDFFKKLEDFLRRAPLQSLRVNYFWDDVNGFFQELSLLCQVLLDIIPTNCLVLLLRTCKTVLWAIPKLEKEHGELILSDVKYSYRNLQYKMAQALDNSLKPKSMSREEVDVELISDFRDITVYPQTKELSMESIGIRKNKIEGSYKNVEQYLDIQFRLLREDFIAPLRQGLAQYLSRNKGNQKASNIIVHTKVSILGKQVVHSEVGFLVQVCKKQQLKNVDTTKRLMFGGLVGFTQDNFNTIQFGKIIDRDEKYLREGQVVIRFFDRVGLKFGQNYTMLECMVFFESYFHVLNALKQINEYNFPLKQYLIDVNYSHCVPRYIKVGYTLKHTVNKMIYTLPVNNHSQWPGCKSLGLNTSQYEALKAALSQTFSIIQGPPGTGKTFIGLKIAKVLLENKLKWKPMGPMLIICFTNHALDQFLEGLLSATQDLVRLGSQSKSPSVQNYILANHRQRHNQETAAMLRERRIALAAQRTGIENTTNILKNIMKCGNIMELFNYHGFQKVDSLFETSWFGVARHSEIVDWLLESPSWDRNQSIQEHERTCYMKNKLNEVKADFRNCKKLLNVDYNNPFNMPFDDRWNLYKYWLNLYTNQLQDSLAVAEEKYRREYKLYEELRNIADAAYLRTKDVIGMTTTCAARLVKMLQTMNCPIVIVEEAAQVLEAHVVAALSRNCQQLILIGDHKQLRPSTADHNIDKKFKLGVSLFERMILNGFRCNTLDIQHRMRPEIAKLVSPAIYPTLKNDKSVLAFPPVKGVHKSLYFITHNNFEDNATEVSKKNSFEVKFIIRLANYLVLNGYNANQITILSAYSEQCSSMVNEQKSYETLKDVKNTISDGYQGEENDIILLSLVRNNNQGSIGFLDFENRVCVALSRAKLGLYIMGNIDLLCKSEIWRKVRKTLEEEGSLGSSLPLQCQKHQNVIIPIKSIDDFNSTPERGCMLKCGRIKKCGHICTKKCHLSPHSTFNCTEPCLKVLCQYNHVCPRLCYKKCKKCVVPKTCHPPCGHVHDIPCYMEPAEYKCVTCRINCGTPIGVNYGSPIEVNYGTPIAVNFGTPIEVKCHNRKQDKSKCSIL